MEGDLRRPAAFRRQVALRAFGLGAHRRHDQSAGRPTSTATGPTTSCADTPDAVAQRRETARGLVVDQLARVAAAASRAEGRRRATPASKTARTDCARSNPRRAAMRGSAPMLLGAPSSRYSDGCAATEKSTMRRFCAMTMVALSTMWCAARDGARPVEHDAGDCARREFVPDVRDDPVDPLRRAKGPGERRGCGRRRRARRRGRPPVRIGTRQYAGDHRRRRRGRGGGQRSRKERQEKIVLRRHRAPRQRRLEKRDAKRETGAARRRPRQVRRRQPAGAARHTKRREATRRGSPREGVDRRHASR